MRRLPLRRPGRWALAQCFFVLPLVALACGDDDAATPEDSGVVSRDDGGAERDQGTDLVDAFVPAPDAPPPSEGVPMFVLQGHMGRTAISCDDGRTWTHDQSLDDSVRCFTDDFDCDHHPGAAKGLAWAPDGAGGGHFLATFGWGPPGSVQRSADGVSWTPVLEETTFGGIAHGDGVSVAGARNARRSTDRGATFSEPIDTGLEVWNVRRAGFAAGRFVLVGSDGGDNDIVTSADGETWVRPTTLPDGCGASIQNRGGVADLGDAIVVIGGDGLACTSTDAGATFTEARIADDLGSHAVAHDGEAFAWSRGELHRSSDGITWTTTPTTPGDLNLGAVAVSDEGTFVAARGGWQTWYGEQEFYRSTDGVTWETLPAASFTGSHPVRAIVFGRPAACPE